MPKYFDDTVNQLAYQLHAQKNDLKHHRRMSSIYLLYFNLFCFIRIYFLMLLNYLYPKIHITLLGFCSDAPFVGGDLSNSAALLCT